MPKQRKARQLPLEDHATKSTRKKLAPMRIAKIVTGLRSISRDGQNDPFQPVSTSTMMANVLELCRNRLFHHGIELRVPETFPHIQIECRETQIEQVLLNLLNNADYAISELPEKWIEVNVLEVGSNIVISVTDSGHGIPSEIRTKIMDPFFTTKPVNQGTGLGLSISKKIIENHHGRLFVDETNRNTRFVVEIPKKQASSPISETIKIAA